MCVWRWGTAEMKAPCLLWNEPRRTPSRSLPSTLAGPLNRFRLAPPPSEIDYSAGTGIFNNSSAVQGLFRPASSARIFATCSTETEGASLPHSLRT